MNIVPFNPGQAPAFAAQVTLTSDQIKAMNAAAAIGTGGSSFNKISLKQSRFRLVVGGQETAVLPVNDLNLVIVRVNEAVTKTWFEKEWNPNDEPTSPECSSDDGIRPRADSPKPQCGPDGLCANCPQNQWGSKINRVTGAKIKACTDTKRMAVMAPDNNGLFAYDGDLYQLQFPPASLKDFGGFVRGLSAGSVPAGYNMVVANIAFDTNVSYPKLVFKPVRWLVPNEWEHVSKRFDSEEARITAGLADAAALHVSAHAVPALGHQPAHLQQAPVQQAPVQQAPVQQAPVQQAPVQQAPVQQAAGWGGAPVQQAPVQQAPVQQAAGWGGAPVQQAPVQQAAGWGGAPVQQAPVQQAPAQRTADWGGAPVQQVPVQQAPVDPADPWAGAQGQQASAQQPTAQRERGKPSPGKSRRTPAEIAEDKAADERDAAAQGGAPAQQAPGVWGGAPVEQAGAPLQPNVAPAAVADAFPGWDD